VWSSGLTGFGVQLSLRRLDASRVEEAWLGHGPQEGTGLQQLGQDDHQVGVIRNTANVKRNRTVRNDMESSEYNIV
jgi:hypothetical protein